MSKAEKVIVAMSGGVDSSVTAALLLDKGYLVEGVFMKNWSPLTDQSLSDCPWEQDQADAEAVCNHLGIPFRSVNFEKEYRQNVVDYLIREYASGRTPNPDVLCNKEIKFHAFLDVARSLGADYIATGHYAQVIDGKLFRGVDSKKDQSYFLYRLDEDQLQDVLMPIGGMDKVETRRIAREKGIPTAQKKDSQGICFIGQLNLKDFLQSEIGRTPGEIWLLPPSDGNSNLQTRKEAAGLVGTHLGVAFHTIGEKMGGYIDNRLYVGLRNHSDVRTTFVVSKDVESNRVYITDDHDDPALYSTRLQVNDLVATGEKKEVSIVDVLTQARQPECQIRYQGKTVNITKFWVENTILNLELEKAVWAVAEGQSAVFYDGSRVLGGGVVCQLS